MWTFALTLGGRIITADAESLCVTLDVLVVEFDTKRPAQVRLPDRVLQPAPGVREPIRYLQNSPHTNIFFFDFLIFSLQKCFCRLWHMWTLEAGTNHSRASRGPGPNHRDQIKMLQLCSLTRADLHFTSQRNFLAFLGKISHVFDSRNRLGSPQSTPMCGEEDISKKQTLVLPVLTWNLSWRGIQNHCLF